MTAYQPWDHYWIIGDDDANVWSSQRAASVPVADAEYVAWQGEPPEARAPARLATMRELEELLAVQYPPGTLNTYTRFKRWEKEQGGITSTMGPPIKTDDRSQAKITGLHTAVTQPVATGSAQPSPPPTRYTDFHFADGTVQTISTPMIVGLNTDLLTHINNCFSISAQVLAGIADGTITTHAQIDDAFDAPMTQANKDWLKV